MRHARMPLWFFGLCLSAEAQQRTVALFDRLCEEWLLEEWPPLASGRLYITVYPIGSFVQSTQCSVADICAVADQVSCAPFDVSFDRAVTWNGTQLVLTSGDDCTALLAFQHELHKAMRRAGVSPVGGWSFKPRMTLRYSERILVDQDVPRFTCRVSEFALIESARGPYRHWPLNGTALTVAA